MSVALILEELKRLSNVERLAVIEAASRLIREDMRAEHRDAFEEQRLRAAAAALKDYYDHDEEVADWRALDADEVLDDSVPR